VPAGGSRQAAPVPQVAVAVSGGLDSTVLLHCVHAAAAPAGIVVHALHVNHGLHPDSSRWQAQIQAQCRRWAARRGGLAFASATLDSRPARGDSVEAWARRERYAALARLAREAGCGIVLLAQHRRDQAETVLLQALRGAGPAGLAAMPAAVERDGIVWLRPWLGQPRERIEAYARRWRLRWVDDPANADTRFARNRVRHAVLPVLREAFPDAERVLAAVARRAHEATLALGEIGAVDAATAIDRGELVVERWLALGAGRRANLLRLWLGATLNGPVPDSLVERLMHEAPRLHDGRWPAGPGRVVQLAAGRLRLAPAGPLRPGPEPSATSRIAVCPIDLSRPGCYAVPQWQGRIEVEPCDQDTGVPAALLQQAQLRPRRGGERFQRHRQSPPRSLKKQYQSAGIDADGRDGPLVWSADRLLYVPGLGIDARAEALPGNERRRLHWSC
jgi:tRNA(Ile)-lysidine synthase